MAHVLPESLACRWLIVALCVAPLCDARAASTRVARWQTSDEELARAALVNGGRFTLELEFPTSGGAVRGRIGCRFFFHPPGQAHPVLNRNVHEHQVTGRYTPGDGIMAIKVGPGTSSGCSWTGRTLSGKVDPAGSVRLRKSQKHSGLPATFEPFRAEPPASSPPPEPQPIGRVIEASGEMVVKDATGRLLRLKSGMNLPDGVDISTGAGARLVVSGLIGRRLTIEPGSTLHCVRWSGDSVRVQLTFGEVIYQSQKGPVRLTAREGLVPSNLLDIETPHAHLKPTGTLFTVRCNRESTRVEVRDGTVEVTLGSGAQGQVTAGQAVEVTARTTEVTPGPASDGAGALPQPGVDPSLRDPVEAGPAGTPRATDRRALGLALVAYGSNPAVRRADDLMTGIAQMLVEIDPPGDTRRKTIRGLWGPHQALLGDRHAQLTEAARELDGISVPAPELAGAHEAFNASVHDLVEALGLLREAIRTGSTGTYRRAASALALANRRYKDAQRRFGELAR